MRVRLPDPGGGDRVSACLDTCRRPSPAQAHCKSGCHRTFGGVGGFDRHRRDGQCLDPATLGYVERDGIWRLPLTEEDAARLGGLGQERRTGLAGGSGQGGAE